MDVRHPHEPGPKFPLLSAFGEELEDGLTDSHRRVFATDFPRASVRPVRRARAGAVRRRAPKPESPSRSVLAPVEPESRVVRRVEAVLEMVSRWVDTRTANEEVGDALERLRALAAARAPAWVLHARAARSAFWVLLHALQEAVRRSRER